MRKTTLFKKFMLDKEILVMPGVHDALAAKMAELAGMKAVCAGGYGASASLLGKPDIALLTQTEMVDQVRRIAESVELPVFADGDTGHGGISNIQRTVKLFEGAGAAGMFIEDQLSPKRCGHMDGKQVVSSGEMIFRLQAALDARNDPDFTIMARTDALAVYGLDEAIKRAVLYREAGADALFVESPRSIDEMKRITSEIPAPTMAVYLEGGKTPLLSAKEFESIGFSIVAYAASSVYASAFAMYEVFKEIILGGHTVNSQMRMIPFSDFNEMLGLSKIRKLEKKYS